MVSFSYLLQEGYLIIGCPENSKLLVFRFLTDKPGIGPVGYRNQVAMVHSAGPAGGRFGLEMASNILAGEPLIVGKDSGGVVLGGKDACLVKAGDRSRRTPLVNYPPM